MGRHESVDKRVQPDQTYLVRSTLYVVSDGICAAVYADNNMMPATF